MPLSDNGTAWWMTIIPLRENGTVRCGTAPLRNNAIAGCRLMISVMGNGIPANRPGGGKKTCEG